jgi:uncharacterized protein
MKRLRLEQRINTYSDYLLKKYGRKVFRVGLSIGTVCPHRQETGGCVFCNPETFTGEYQSASFSISQQLEIAIPRIKENCGDVAILAYFQDETSTAGNLIELRDKFSEALAHPEIIGLVLSTRPDYINPEVVEMLKSLDTEISIELGMQTIHNKSLEFLNRGHSHEQTTCAVQICKTAGFNVGVHLIVGIPGESKDEILQTIKYISSNENIDQVKFHNLVVYKNTELAQLVSPNQIMNIEEYIEVLAEVISYLREDIVISRLFTSNIRRNQLAVDSYTGNKTKWMNSLRLKLIEKNIVQGSELVKK